MVSTAIRRWAICGGAVLVLHAALLSQWPAAPASTPRMRWLQVGLVAPQVRALPVGPESAPPARMRRPPAPEAAKQEVGPAGAQFGPAPRPPVAVRAEGRAAVAAPSTEGRRRAASQGAPPPARDLRPSPAVAPEPAAPILDLPIYPTALPPTGTWHYRLLHNGHVGDAELRWEHEDAHYRASLDAHEDGAPALTLRSNGQLDAAGLAPQRFVDQRGRRGAQAANFRREADTISYSGSALQHPLPAGAQDRLSLWLQLAAIVAAQPGHWVPGSTITTYASGAHGDAELWTWAVQGLAPIDDDARDTPRALHLHRDPPRLYDTEADAWLDPAIGYLPARLRWRNGPYTFDLRLAR
jgi:hypothetical protein